jgi:hypothetical protein
MLNQAEWDVQLATGWTEDQVLDQPAEKILILHMRWQYNQTRFGGFGVIPGLSSGQPQRSARDDHWRSQTIEHGGGRVTKRFNIEDLWNPNFINEINNAGGGR